MEKISWLSNSAVDCSRITVNEPLHDKTNKVACAPSEDSDQPGHEENLGP